VREHVRVSIIPSALRVDKLSGRALLQLSNSGITPARVHKFVHRALSFNRFLTASRGLSIFPRSRNGGKAKFRHFVRGGAPPSRRRVHAQMRICSRKRNVLA